MNVININNEEKMNHISLGEIFSIISTWITSLKNELNKLNYIETSLKKEKDKNIQPKDKQIPLYKLKKLIIETINIKKQIEDFSNKYKNYTNYKNNNANTNIDQIEKDEMVKYTLKDLNNKNQNILMKIKEFVDKFPLLKNYMDNFCNQKMSLSERDIKKERHKSFIISNIKVNKIKYNGNGNDKFNYDFLDSQEKKIKKDALKKKINNIHLTGENEIKEMIINFNDDKSYITPSNKYIKEFCFNNFISNEPNSTTNLLKDSSNNNINSNPSENIFKSKKISFIKNRNENNTNENIISNQNFHIHNSCNNSSINLNIINNNSNNTNKNINKNKIIPNNYKQKNQPQQSKVNSNSIEAHKNMNKNQNIEIQDINHKKSKNSNILNFPLKNILLDQKNLKKQKKVIKFKKLKANLININYPSSNPRAIGLNNLLNTSNKKIYNRPLNKENRNNSEYFLKPIKSEVIIHRNKIMNENSLRGFSLDNLNLKNFDIQNKNTNIIKKRKAKIRNRTINIFNDNESVIVTTPNRNMSFSFANKNAINNKNIKHFYTEHDFDIREENIKLKKEIFILKKEMESIRIFCNNLKDKISRLEEQNDILKKENKAILKFLKNKK